LLKKRIRAEEKSVLHRVSKRGLVRPTLSELSVHLPAKNVEQIRRLGQVRDLHVAVLMLTVKLVFIGEYARIFVTKLKIALDATRRVFRALTVVTVGKTHHQACTLDPLDLSRCDELVDYALGVVRKISELRFPHD
jgi:hypothetical protein